MAKKTKDADGDFFADLAKDTGGELLKGSGNSAYFIDSGNLAFNWSMSNKFFGGGYPTGITEVYGPSSSAKSLLGYIASGWCQKMGGIAIWLDCERASNEEFAKTAGHVDEGKLVVQRPNYIEEVSEKIIATVKKIRANKKYATCPLFFVWDSIGVTMCHREFKELNLPPNYTKEQYKAIVGGKEQPGERAKAAGAFLRKINLFLDENNASLFVINQVRDKIGVMFGSPETTAGGGKGLPFYANTRVRTSAQKQIIDKKKSTSKNKVACGVNLKFANKKARACAPFRNVEGIQLYFDRGINPLGGLLSALLAAGRIEAAGKGMYKVLEPFAGGKEVKFKGSLARGDVDPQVLYGCPALVDAETEEQLREYLGVFAEAIDMTGSDDIEEINVDDEGDEEEDGDAVAAKLGIDTGEAEEE